LHKNNDKKLYKTYKFGHFDYKILTYISFNVIFDSAVDITFHEKARKNETKVNQGAAS